MNRLHTSNAERRGKSVCVRDVDPLCTKTSLLCGKWCLSVEGFFGGACLMAAFEGAGEGNVTGSASIKDFSGGDSMRGATQGCTTDGYMGVRVSAGV